MIATVRDISIIFLAIESIIVLVLLSILIVQIRNLVILLNEEIKPMLEATQETASTVRNTTNFVSTRVARPAIDALSFGAGVRQAFSTLKGGRSNNPKSEPTSPTPSAPPPAPAPANGANVSGGNGGE